MGESNVNVTKFIVFCRKTLFLEVKEINWEANVWYVEKLNIASEYSCAVKPHIRAGGNRQSGIWETAIASLLA